MARKAPGKAHREGLTVVELMDMFPTEEAATKWFESVIWPNGRHCGKCGSTETKEVPNAKPMPYWCKGCRSYFSVRTGTPIARSNVPLRKWVIAIYLCLTSLKSVSSMKLQRDIGILLHGRHPSERACIHCDTSDQFRVLSIKNAQENPHDHTANIIYSLRIDTVSPQYELYRCSVQLPHSHSRIQLASDTLAKFMSFEPAPLVFDRIPKSLYYNPLTGETCNTSSRYFSQISAKVFSYRLKYSHTTVDSHFEKPFPD